MTSQPATKPGVPGVALLTRRWSVRISHWLLVAELFLLALFVRLYHLGNQSLWLDEGSTWQTIQQGWGVLLADLLRPVSAYPLYHLLLKSWVALAGDSEWALRFPSALAGAGAVVALYFAALEVQRPTTGSSRFPVAAGVLLLVAPFAIWYAQEAKVYSLLLLVATLLLWSLLRALRLRTWQAWLCFACMAGVSIVVHRLAVLLLVASAAAWLWESAAGRRTAQQRTWSRPMVAGVLALLLVSVGVVVAMVYGLGSELASTGAYIPAQPLLALWLTFVNFSLHRQPGEVAWWWLLPWAVLALWGLALLFAGAARGERGTRVLLCFLLVPLALFLLQLAFTHLYQTRYLMLIYPAWVLLLAYPAHVHARHHTPRGVYWMMTGLVFAGSLAMLVQPGHGIFSGQRVKEQYREAVQELARRVHPDDLIVLHPAYLRPLYTYYMHRFTADPPPEPVTFDDFKFGQTEFTQRDWDDARMRHFAGSFRSFLLIAPNHARTVDAPPTTHDEYGLVGLYYQYSRDQKKWPCGIWRSNGVHLLCQTSPEAYETGAVLTPQTPLPAQFGEEMHFLGYTLKATMPAGPGVYRAGGTVPITLFWDVAHQPAHDYHVFLHLCRDCSVPPAASDDGPPLDGYLPTSTWLPGKPARDDRAIPLPPDMEPGRYTLLMGLYQPDNPAESARLPVEPFASDRPVQVLPPQRLVLGEIEVVAP
jgi:hypothetical protein